MNFLRPLTDYIYMIPAILISLTFHELSHAFVSYKLGDPTAKNQGRLSLNPLKHLDPLGTIMLLVSNFGWAKPVRSNPMYYKNRRKGIVLVSFAGPAANLILAILAYIVNNILLNKYNTNLGQWDIRFMIYNFNMSLISKNIGLVAFNLLPFPPLDGFKILGCFLSQKNYFKMLSYENYISIAFLFLVFIFPGVLLLIMTPFTVVLSEVVKLIAIPISRLFL